MSTDAPSPQPKPEYLDPHDVPIVFVDWLITAGMFDGIVNLAVGTIDQSRRRDMEDAPKIVVAGRFRMPQAVALNLHRVLGNILGLNAPGEESPPPAAPPHNTIN